MKYIVELTAPNGANAYFTPGRGFHGDRKFADSFGENDRENKLQQAKQYLEDHWQLCRYWEHWGGCSREDIIFAVVPK